MTRPADHGVDPGTLELLRLTVATAMTNRRQDREARGLPLLDKETADQQTLSEIAAVVQQYRAGRAAAGGVAARGIRRSTDQDVGERDPEFWRDFRSVDEQRD